MRGALAVVAVAVGGLAMSAQARAATVGQWSATGSMTGARNSATATSLPDGDVLVAGGSGTNGLLSSAELYDPDTATWSTTGSMTTPRDAATATALPDGDVLVAGGGTSNGDFNASAELYDPSAGTWSTTGSMSTSRASATATLLAGGDVLVAGGTGGGSALNYSLSSVELYDPSAGTWSTTGSMNATRSNATATLLPDGDVLVAGGYSTVGLFSGSVVSSAELYDPDTGTWSTTGSMTTPRQGATATSLPDGDVLVTGGNNGTDLLSSAELYDPDTGTWSTTGSMTTPHDGATATSLPDGDVLLAGGDDGSLMTSAELYDPVTGTWSTTGSMTTPRLGATATSLPDGDVLVAGGNDGTGPVASAEIYDVPKAASVTIGAPFQISDTTAALTGTVDPNGQATTYRFELSTTSTFTGQIIDVPSAGSDAGAGDDPVTVSGSAAGLSPDTGYFVRLVATNPAGTTTSAVQQLTTSPAPAAPVTTTGASPTAPPVARPPLQITDIALSAHTLTWCLGRGCGYPAAALRFTLSQPATLRLVLRVRAHRRWHAVATTHLRGHQGVNHRRIAGRWHGQLLPARRVQILIQLQRDGRWVTNKTLILDIHRRPLGRH